MPQQRRSPKRKDWDQLTEAGKRERRKRSDPEYKKKQSEASSRYQSKTGPYLTALARQARRNAANRGIECELSPEDLMFVWLEQEGKCALTGRDLTTVRGAGTVLTNASVDRIEPGGPYVRANVRLVCRWVNSARLDTEGDCQLVNLVLEAADHLRETGRDVECE